MATFKVTTHAGDTIEVDTGHDYGAVLSCRSSDPEGDERGTATMSCTSSDVFRLARALLEAIAPEIGDADEAFRAAHEARTETEAKG